MIKVLHIASVDNSPYSGVSVVVPEHIRNQSNYAQVALVNLSQNNYLTDLTVFSIDDFFSGLPTPFDKPDIVIIHEVFYFQYIKISKILQKRNIPYVIVPHGSLTDRALKIKRIKKIVGQMVFHNYISRASAVQFLSMKEQKLTNIKNKSFVSTNGIYVPILKKEKFSNDEMKFIYIGRLSIFHKGLDLMIDAVGLIQDELRKRNFCLSIFGPASEAEKLELSRLVSNNNVSDLIIIHNEISGQNKARALLDSDVFIQTSRFEGMPMGILEAMSMGLPCLITEGTTLGQFVSENNAGWVSGEDVKSIAEQIIIAADDIVNFEEKSKNARSSVKKEFSWNVIAENAIQNYMSIVSK